MNAILRHTNRIPVEVRAEDNAALVDTDDWAFFEFGDEATMIDFLGARMAKSKDDIRLLLESYDELNVQMTVRAPLPQPLPAELAPLVNGG